MAIIDTKCLGYLSCAFYCVFSRSSEMCPSASLFSSFFSVLLMSNFITLTHSYLFPLLLTFVVSNTQESISDSRVLSCQSETNALNFDCQVWVKILLMNPFVFDCLIHAAEDVHTYAKRMSNQIISQHQKIHVAFVYGWNITRFLTLSFYKHCL